MHIHVNHRIFPQQNPLKNRQHLRACTKLYDKFAKAQARQIVYASRFTDWGCFVYFYYGAGNQFNKLPKPERNRPLLITELSINYLENFFYKLCSYEIGSWILERHSNLKLARKNDPSVSSKFENSRVLYLRAIDRWEQFNLAKQRVC